MNNTGNQTICITGVSGFLGSHLLRRLETRTDIKIRALFHNREINNSDRIIAFKGNLLQSSTLPDFVGRDSTVINLVYMREGSPEDNILAIDNLASTCVRVGIKRFIHCSTAVVAGMTAGNIVNEKTIPHPTNVYERNKLAVEQLLLEKYSNFFEIIIVRPTAIFGSGGQNLLKLADHLLHGNKAINYLRSCLFDNRKMNIVAVENVTAAIEFLADIEIGENRSEIFIISDDEDVINEYRKIESLLMGLFNQKYYPIPCIPIPSFVLKMMLRLTNKTNYNPYTHYSCEKLLESGFKKPVQLFEALKEFSQWYLTKNRGPS